MCACLGRNLTALHSYSSVSVVLWVGVRGPSRHLGPSDLCATCVFSPSLDTPSRRARGKFANLSDPYMVAGSLPPAPPLGGFFPPPPPLWDARAECACRGRRGPRRGRVLGATEAAGSLAHPRRVREGVKLPRKIGGPDCGEGRGGGGDTKRCDPASVFPSLLYRRP